MKKLPSLFKTSAIIYFAGIASFLSKAMWNSSEFWHSMLGIQQPMYWVPVDEYSYEPVSSSASSIISTVVKCIEGVLIGVIFLVWIISFLRIRKIEDKELKAKKTKRTIITVVVLLVIGILIWLWYRLYNKYYW